MEDSQTWREELWPEWTVDSHLGSGGCGHVYKIRRSDLGGTYFAALKVLSVTDVAPEALSEEEHLAQRSGLLRDISRELAVMERLKGHTNIVSYEDHKILADGDGALRAVLIRMELLTPLTEHLNRTGCPEPEVIRLGRDICEALTVCQREGIIHRDIKPANILVTHYGSYKLGDFGIALKGGPGLTTRSARGTYPYMAPEVFRGEPYDASIDTYALGLILYRLLNHGRAPFLPLPPEPLTSEAVEQSHRRRLAGNRLASPAQASPALARVILRACAPDPRDRYRSAADMKRDLERCVSGEPGADFRGGGKYLPREPDATAAAARPAPKPESKTEGKARMNKMFSAAGDL